MAQPPANERGVGARLRALLQRDQPLVAPGVYDALTARLAERAGFEAVFISGAAVSASLLARPDLGFLTMTEALAQASHIASAVGVPVIADCDTGFGSAVTARRTVEVFEQAGVAALVIEDQTTPKRCGHFQGKGIVSTAEMVAKLRSVVSARRDPDLVVVARTDALAVAGLEEALRRLDDYRAAGADVVFVEAPPSEGDLAAIGSRARDVALMVNLVEGGRTPLLSSAQLFDLGFRLITYSGTLQKVAIHAMQKALAHLRDTGDVAHLYPSTMVSLADRSEILELAKYEAIERELYADKP